MKMPETLASNEKITPDNDETNCEVDKTIDKPQATEDESHNKEAPDAAVTVASYDLNNFRLQRILNNNIRNKSIALLGNFPNLSESDYAIVILEKKAFEESDVATTDADKIKTTKEEENGKEEPVFEDDMISSSSSDVEDDKKISSSSNVEDDKKISSSSNVEDDKPSYFCNDLKVQTEFINDIYGSYQCTPPAELSGIKATVVYPATDKHIQKYSICQKYLIREYPGLYEELTLPYITSTSTQFSLEWVYNILEHKQETERIVFEDPDPETGFILLPDLKWDGRNVETMYVLAIIHKRNIKSLRDLNDSHIPLLQNIRKQAAEAIEKRYGLVSTQLRMYFHYQPSFYHLHVHINTVGNDAPGIWCDKSHMLDTVINNLELLPDYYQKATLPFVLFESSKLLELYEAVLTVRKVAKTLADPIKKEEEIEEEEEIMVVEDTEMVII